MQVSLVQTIHMELQLLYIACVSLYEEIIIIIIWGFNCQGAITGSINQTDLRTIQQVCRCWTQHCWSPIGTAVSIGITTGESISGTLLL